MNQVNLDEEEIIKCMTDQKINEQTNKLPSLLRRVVQNSDREMMFDGIIIHYKLSASQIDVDGEDKSRRNDIIECWIETNKINDTFLEHFVKICMEKYKQYSINKINKKFIYQNIDSQWEKVCEREERMADTIILKDDDKKILLDEVEHFINNKEWYINHGFLYSLGILLHGSPGTGKTSLIRYISTITERNTHYLRLSQINSEQDFNKLLKNLNLETTILVMEDVDCAGNMVHSRDKIYADEKEKEQDKNVIKIIIPNNETNKDRLTKNEKFTLDVLLNILDGILTTSGQIVIMTTNYKDVLDKALIRPGRIDVNLELSKCTHKMINQLCKNFYNLTEIENDLREEINKIPEDKHTPAHVMNIFRKYRHDVNNGIKKIDFT